MNILYLIAMFGSQYLGNLIHREIGHAFQAHGHTFRVFALSSHRERAGLPAETVEENITVHRAITAGRTTPNVVNAAARPVLHYDRFGMGWWTLRRYLSAHPETDLILAEGAYPFGAMAALARRGTRPRLGITVAGGDFINDRASRYGYGRFRSARYLMRYAFQRSAFIRVTTPLVRSRVLALGASPEKIALIPRNIASYCYPPSDLSLANYRQTSRAQISARYNLGDAPLIVSVGRLLPIKGFDILIRSLRQIQSTVPKTHLLIIGPNRIDSVLGDYQKYLSGVAAENGLSDSVTFTGIVQHQDMRQYLAAADVIAVPSILEGMNKVAVEGAAVGTPSVVTRTAGIADLMTDANLGEIVEPNSPDELAVRLTALLCDPARRAELGERGIIWAQQFSSAVVASQLIELCSQSLP